MPVLVLPMLLILALAVAAEAQITVPVDMAAGWIRRDWHGCKEPSPMTARDGAITIATDSSGALYWQVPTKSGRPLAFDLDRDWIRNCDRPPADFGSEIEKRAREDDLLIDVGIHRFFTWRWRISNTLDDSRTADRKGRIQTEGDDFAVKLGVTLVRKGSDDLREIAYVWTRRIPEGSVLIQEKRVLFWKFQFHRIVARSGEREAGRWVSESRDLYDDYRRLFPGEEPGRIVRIYVMTDSDNTGGRATGSFADLAFHVMPPPSVVSRPPSGATADGPPD